MPSEFKVSALALTCALVLSPKAFSQDQSQAEKEKEVEKIMVTGSRIATDTNLFSSTPVQSIDAEDVRLSGELNLADVVNDIPALVSSLTAENSTSGANQLNLRGLGADRTLTLVNGRRHVAGFRGSQSVDIGSIPRGLVERVEVTTGGASAVYGADAVTGVVNFILKDDYEGFQVDVRGAVPDASGGENFALDALYGLNFDNDKGNAVFAVSLSEDTVITMGDRSWSRDNGISSITPRANPDPNGPPQAVIDDPRFWLTSQEGSIAPGFGGRNTTYVDINGNGIPDCQESEGGRVGFLAGCWLTNPDGSVRVNQDGIVLGSLWGTGGDGGRVNLNEDYLLPETDSATFNLNMTYDFNDNVRGFFEGKYVYAESTFFTALDTFYDTLFIMPDNPFIPAQLQPVVDVTGGLLLTQDPVDFSDNNPDINKRETTRFVAGIEWYVNDNHLIEFSVNHGQFKNTEETTGLYLDRVFAAMDAVTGPDGNPVCRSDLDPTAAYEIDYFTAANNFANGAFSSSDYYSFTPGDGQCAPLNPFGFNSVSTAAQDFVTSQLQNVLTVKQTVVALIASGEIEALEGIFDGPVGYAGGVEWREETSDNQLDPITLGILPQGSPLGAGTFVGDVSPWLNSYTSIDNVRQFNTSGRYDVIDYFLEVRAPIFQDREFAKELTVDAAIRQADYSTLGNATTWKVGMTYAPVEDLSFRATFSEAVRAPNITELFDPRLPLQINSTEDPCEAVDAGTSQREGNCIAALQAAGVPMTDIVDDAGNYIWVNPLTGRFTGTQGGNPELDVETAETLTVGLIFQPSFIEGLSITIDYWDIEIEDAIAAVGADDILRGCLDSPNFPNVPFCEQFTRRSDGGLNGLDTGQINFARQAADGIDFSISYSFDIGENEFNARLVGTKQGALDNFFNPQDPNDVDPELQEVQLPELSGSLDLSWTRGDLTVAVQTLYQDEQSVDEIERVLGLGGQAPLYGDAGFFDETYVHDINVSYNLDDQISIYGGVNNLTDEEPFATQTAWPVGPRGRTFFLGVSYRH